MSDFVIENRVLTRYTGIGGDVVIPEGVTEIGYEAFYWCRNLQSVVIPKSVAKIGREAFYGCSNLQSVVIPKSVTKIGNEAFRRCRVLGDDDGFVIVNNILFDYLGNNVNVTIPEGVTKIGDSAFSECKNLQSIVIPEGVTKIGSRAFSGCENLQSVIIPKGVTRIEEETFSGCSNLQSVIIPEGIAGIGYCAFFDCTNLQSVVIPKSVTKIGSRAFSGCENLQSAVIPESVNEIGKGAFHRCDKLADENGFVIIRNVLYSYHSNSENIVIPEGVTEIGNDAFSRCTNLKSIVIPERFLSKFNIISSGGCVGVIAYSDKEIKLLAYSSKSNSDNFTDFVEKGSWNTYDIDLINNGPYYKYKLPARLLGALGRLNDPVELTDECKELYVELLVKNAKKLIPIAEEIDCPEIVEMMIKHKIINDGNRKAINKLLKASANEKIAAFAE